MDIMTLRNLFEHAVETAPREHTYSRWFEAGQWCTRTYAETYERVRHIAEWLGQHGVRPKHSHVALILPNCPTWVELYLAVVGLGAVVVHVDPKLTAPELHHILYDSNAEMVLTDPAHLPMVEQLISTLPDLRQVVLTQAVEDVTCSLPVAFLDELLACEQVPGNAAFWDEPAYRPEPDGICGILYTSGTTGKPKGAMLTHRNFVADAQGTLALFEGYLTREDDMLVVLPLFHAFAFTGNFVLSLLTQSSLSYLRSLRTVGDDLKACQSAVLMTVPLMAEKLHNRLLDSVTASWKGRVMLRLFPKVVGKKVQEALGGKLKMIFVGGAKCETHIQRDFLRMGITMVEGYGLTECAPIVSVCPPRAIRVGTIGVAVAGIDVRIAHPNEQGVGELQVKGPINFPGYWNNDGATAATFEEGWLKTGDLATIDKDGYIVIRGRAKALIVNREGKNIYPEEVEQAIIREPLIDSVLVLAYQTKGEAGEKVGALLTPNHELIARQYPKATEAEIEAMLREAVKQQCATLATYKHPRKVVISATPLERTSTSKIRRGVYVGALDE